MKIIRYFEIVDKPSSAALPRTMVRRRPGPSAMETWQRCVALPLISPGVRGPAYGW